MFIFSESDNFFLDKHLNPIDTFEIGYDFKIDELNKIDHKPGYKYYICLGENDTLPDLEPHFKKLDLNLKRVPSVYDKQIISSQKYITFCKCL